jgi:segregation and condensation protein B
MNSLDAKYVLEAALICATKPLSVRELMHLFEGQMAADSIRVCLDELRVEWRPRGVELVCLSSGWRFQSRPEIQNFLDRLNPEKPPRYSRAVLETLAIVAYRQPVTRGDIEELRGVVVSTQIIRQLEDRQWVEVIGHRDAPGRPALYATTRQFLDDLALQRLDDLPDLRPRMEQSTGAQAELLALQSELELNPEPKEDPESAVGMPDSEHHSAYFSSPSSSSSAENALPLN